MLIPIPPTHPVFRDDTVTEWHSSNGTHHVEFVELVSALSDQSFPPTSCLAKAFLMTGLIMQSGTFPDTHSRTKHLHDESCNATGGQTAHSMLGSHSKQGRTNLAGVRCGELLVDKASTDRDISIYCRLSYTPVLYCADQTCR